MANYTVSARKYRPSTFKSVVGQQHITKTLRNAIRNQQIAQSFLFTGPRGIGKTTCARILAKTVNCEAPTEEGEACNECSSCVTFNNNQSFNFYELDAASNNSVEDIRNLVDQVRFPPQSGKYKVYIIDEVHMLSQSAFNAFLKTLEEPPSYAIFILATTEKHKILPTILSRCQIFDFNRIGVKDIADHIKGICQKEGIEAEDDALFLISQKADGALRDSLSILDRIISFSGEKITYQDVVNNLNILDYDYFLRITEMLYSKDLPSSLILLDEIINKGFDLHNFLNGLCSHFRDLLMIRNEATSKLVELPGNIAQSYQEQSSKMSEEYILSGLNILNQFDTTLKGSKNQRLHLELALMKLCHLNDALDLSQLEEAPATDEGKKKVAEDSSTQTSGEHKASVTNVGETQSNKKGPSSKLDLNALKSTVRSKRSEAREKEEEDHQKESTEEESTPKQDPPSEEKILECWKGFLKKLETEKPSLRAALNQDDAEVTQADTLKVNVPSAATGEMLESFKPRLMEILRERTGWDELQLESKVVVKEEANNEEKDTPKKRYERMVARNPNIEKLVERFKLKPESNRR